MASFFTKNFKLASQYKCRLNAIPHGINEYVPILFDENHFCYLNATFHTTILGEALIKNKKKTKN